MKRKLSVLIDERAYEGLERRARRHGTTISGEARRAIEGELANEASPSTSEEDANPNQGLLDLMDELARMPRPPRDPSIPSAGDPGFKKWLRDSMAEDRLQNHRG